MQKHKCIQMHLVCQKGFWAFTSCMQVLLDALGSYRYFLLFSLCVSFGRSLHSSFLKTYKYRTLLRQFRFGHVCDCAGNPGPYDMAHCRVCHSGQTMMWPLSFHIHFPFIRQVAQLPMKRNRKRRKTTQMHTNSAEEEKKQKKNKKYPPLFGNVWAAGLIWYCHSEPIWALFNPDSLACVNMCLPKFRAANARTVAAATRVANEPFHRGVVTGSCSFNGNQPGPGRESASWVCWVRSWCDSARKPASSPTS